ncbi:DNA starvation/stationary phase protection protein [Nocardioidaceae bacterium]|nr:DNA starvation/stationary phase protection protein [Nocardioidaceae bacterium]
MTDLHFTTPGISESDAVTLVEALQSRLHAVNDLHLVLKHVHWNVVGPHFIAVHEMLDPQVDEVRGHADDLAERIATLGGSPKGTPGSLVSERTWDDYSLRRASTQEHLAALDVVYTGVLEDYRKARATAAEIDPVSEDMIIGQIQKLELFHWFIRAHLETQGGALRTDGADTEKGAASQV